MAENRFFRCAHCGNTIGMIKDSGVPIICCGEPMQHLKANSVDASTEKHVPVVSADGDTITVKVGSAAHPMEEAHYIEWIFIQTQSGGQRKALTPGAAPEAVFALAGDKVIAAYAFCNIHGLWKAEL